MCEYSYYDEKKNLMCKANSKLCTLCVMGNHKTYNKAKSEEHSNKLKNSMEEGNEKT